MKLKTSTAVGLSLVLWAGLSYGAHWLWGEPAAYRLPTAAASSSSNGEDLPNCNAEEVRSRLSDQLNAQSSQDLEVQTAAAPRMPSRQGSRTCVATVSGPLAQVEMLFLIQWDKGPPGEWSVELVRQ
ncbi:hypothetical protein SAMN02745157_1604 [Kaistia soli DSM 19436]|uniref:Uncharacterized protein n=1 Tax=Kaistia soli DSM 19436 TaxID=1122133 RepID=A0A1M4YSS9_9HYPH|nr:hypothetical protein SAMN02745157_1604 [Kaistia soli DSM 19436]